MDEGTHFTINHLIDTWCQLVKCLAENPEKLTQSQMNYWQDYLNLFRDQNNQQGIFFGDKRFAHQEWQQNLAFHFVKQTYLLLSQHINDLVRDVTSNEAEHIAKKLQFYTRQFNDAFSPTNFAHLNPEILAQTLETNGNNLLNGMHQFLADLENGSTYFTPPLTDLEAFELGKNIACTPGKVILQNDLMQLIQYTAQTETVYQIPLLMVPPWINKFYILDLQQENSLVKWLVSQGFTVFMISWVNPNGQHREKQFADYMTDGLIAALNKIKQVSKEPKVNVLGYCIGGTLLSCLLAYLGKKEHQQINSATFLTTLFDFSEPGDLGIFMDESQLHLLEYQMQQKGYLDGHILAAVFNVLRANDLIWSAFIHNYLKGQKPKPFDLLYWNSDYTNVPADVHTFYLRNMYQHNRLIQPNALRLAEVPLDLTQITVPAYFLAAHDDHIVPWRSAYNSVKFYGGSAKFVLTNSGHVAGVINPPHRQKYGYWTLPNSIEVGENIDDYLTQANFHQGSWWEDWIGWLKKYSREHILHSELKKSPSLEKAPGSYVKQRI